MAEPSRRDQVLQQLTAGIAELTSSDAWRSWLEVQGRFHQYSFGNCLLILRQRREATRVAGFHSWRKLGRTVRRAETGIWILAPVTRRAERESEDGQEQSPARMLSGFRPVAVFDIAQTEGEPLPDGQAQRLRGCAPERTYEALVDVAERIGYAVQQDHLPGGRNGDCAFELRRIRVELSNDSAQQVKTLAHELAHAILHEHCTDRALAELEAESVAYVVCNRLGLDTDAYSFGYVAGWAGGGEQAIAAIKLAAGRIQHTAAEILTIAEERDDIQVSPVAA